MPTNPTDLWYLLWLHHTLGGYSGAIERLLSRFRSAESVFHHRADACATLSVRAPGLAKVLANAGKPEADAVDRALNWLEGPERHLLLSGHDDYPVLLTEIEDPPPVLFVCGDHSLLNSRQISVVGTRRPSHAGRSVARSLAASLVHAGLTITSGLARGIDSAAHEGALDAQGRTVAVMGTGCDLVYPRSNRDLAERIRVDGAIVSEFPLGMPALPQNFPRRNRIVTGLSFGTVIVEAALKSGSLISARLAAEQGRDVFAMPGSVQNPLSRGCHQLIRDGAILTESIQDILEELPAEQRPVVEAPTLTEASRQVFQMLDSEPCPVDLVAKRCNLPVNAILSLLVELQMAGLVQTTLGGYYRTPGLSLRP